MRLRSAFLVTVGVAAACAEPETIGGGSGGTAGADGGAGASGAAGSGTGGAAGSAGSGGAAGSAGSGGSAGTGAAGASGGGAGTGGAAGAGAGGSSGAAGTGGSAGAASVCGVGDTRACLGPGACAGAQSCLPNRSGWDTCDCGTSTGGTGGSGGTGTGGAGGSTGGTGGATGGTGGATGGTGGATGGTGGTTGCGTGQKTCGGICVDIGLAWGCSDRDEDCIPCGAPTNGSNARCSGGSCEYDCDPGYVAIGESCELDLGTGGTGGSTGGTGGTGGSTGGAGGSTGGTGGSTGGTGGTTSAGCPGTIVDWNWNTGTAPPQNQLTFVGSAWSVGAATGFGPADGQTYLATVPGGLYPNGSNAAVQLPDIDLTGNAGCQIRVTADLWRDAEKAQGLYWDGGNLQYTTNPGASATWYPLEGAGMLYDALLAYSVSSQLGCWSTDVCLPALQQTWTGSSNPKTKLAVWQGTALAGSRLGLRFTFYSDATGSRAGIYVRSVKVEAIP